MARRIAVAVLALITGLLAVVAVPLGLLTAAQDRRDFRVEVGAEASALANVAEERIDDGRGTALSRSVADLDSHGDRVAQEEIARLARLTNGLLAVARAENTTAPPARVDVAAVARDRVAAWRPAAEERGVGLTVTAPHPAGAELGADHLEQILDNLLANALDALETGGAISVTAGAAGAWARVTVSDDGRGMSGQQQRAAFRRFASGTAGGTGLGLAIVNRLAVANGGSAGLSDTPGGGLTVTIELPLRDGILAT